MVTQEMLLRVQEAELDILQKIDAICRRHGLTYFGIGGTALGAVRHQGFIPWDDDIDVGMPRKDYEAFLQIAARELPEGYFIQHFSTEPDSPFYFTKIRKSGTRFVEYYVKDMDIHQGIFVDIFPFDNVPKNKTVCNLHFRFCRFLYQLYLCRSLSTAYDTRFTQAQSRKGKIRKVLHTLLLPIPKGWIYGLLNRSVQMFNGRDTRELSHIVRRRLRVYLEDLYPIRHLPFGPYEMPVPNNYDTYLKAQFGNYETLPPEEKRYGHLPYQVEFEAQEDPL